MLKKLNSVAEKLRNMNCILLLNFSSVYANNAFIKFLFNYVCLIWLRLYKILMVSACNEKAFDCIMKCNRL